MMGEEHYAVWGQLVDILQTGENAFEKLGRRFLLAHTKSCPAARAVHLLNQWVSQLGPCFRWEK